MHLNFSSDDLLLITSFILKYINNKQQRPYMLSTIFRRSHLKQLTRSQTISKNIYNSNIFCFSNSSNNENQNGNDDNQSKPPKQTQFPIPIKKTSPVPQKINSYYFLKNAYGLQVNRHVFPSQVRQIILTKEQLSFYKKTSPNYIVALISKKVINDAVSHPQGENNSNDQIDINHHSENSDTVKINDPNSVQNKFYRVCTYCKVKYEKNMAILEGIHRCKIQEIQEIQIKNAQQQNYQQMNNENQQSLIVSQEDIEKSQSIQKAKVEPLQSTSGNQTYEINQILQNTMYKRNKKVPQKPIVYSLVIKKIQELPLMISSHLQMKFKYLINTYDTYTKISNPTNQYSMSIYNIIDIANLLDRIASECSESDANKDQVQKCLEARQMEDRIDCIQKLIQNRIHFATYFKDIERAAQSSLRNKKFYEYYSQIMSIAKKVMDGKKAKQLFLEKCNEEFYEKNPTDQIKQVFQNEKVKYQQTDENSMQFGVIKTYLQELSKIPYNIKSKQFYDLQYAEKILNEEHYGMSEVKQAILEIIAVGKLKKTLKGKIFCLIGGPGLGKTTFAKSVAKALNRKFYNISLGGVSDSSVLKGHRRTYMGAYSGKIIEALKNCGTNNPVILLDQIDKMGRSNHGDPRSQLLQILDPNQNQSFIDNFVDVKIDLSNVLFICTANYQQNISKPLIDRMQRVKLTSYTNHEKIEIFKQHLLRRAIDKSGVKQQQFQLQQGVIQSMVRDYCMGEPGVRYLEKNILNTLEKIAYKIVTNEQPLPIKVTNENIKDYLGNTYYRQRDHSKITKGVAIGLGGGNYGGRLTYIQSFKKSHSTSKQHKRGLMFTGSLGDIFKQAMNISYTFARNYLNNELKNTYLYENQVHIHAPDGAQKKDGATDSLTITSSLISLALQKQVKKSIGMTGQLTLHGKVLRTHGIKEKILVAKRQKLKEIIVPFQNRPQVQILSQQIKQGMQFHFVRHYSQVYEILFGSGTTQMAQPIQTNLQGNKNDNHNSSIPVAN